MIISAVRTALVNYDLPTKLVTGAGVLASHVTAPIGKLVDRVKSPAASPVETHTTMDARGVSSVTVAVKIPCAPEKLDQLTKVLVELASPKAWGGWFEPFKGSVMVGDNLEEKLTVQTGPVKAEVWNSITFKSSVPGGNVVKRWDYVLERSGGMRVGGLEATRQAQGVTVDEGFIEIIKHPDGVEMRGLKLLAFDPANEPKTPVSSAVLNKLMDFNAPWLTEQFLRQMGNDIQKEAAKRLK